MTVTTTLFQRLGGKAAVNAAVDLFYEKVVQDERIAHYFASIDLPLQRDKQKGFMTMAFGGPVRYTGQDLRTGHAHLPGLNDEHFDAVVEILDATLAELGIDAELRGEVAELVEGTRSEVLGR